MEKRERRERHRRSQAMNQRHSKPPPSSQPPPPVAADKKVIDHTAIPDPHMFDNLKRETDDIAALNAQKKHGGKRQIFSNWAKYETPPLEGETEDEQRIGADYETLLQGAQLGSQLQLRSERSWDPKGLPAQSAAFTIDLGVLAAALECLPVYERLQLPLDLFTMEELELMEQRARLGRESWCQRSSALEKKVEAESQRLALCGSLLEALTDSSNLRGTSAERGQEREHSPHESKVTAAAAKEEEAGFDFGMVSSHAPSDISVSPFKKERSVEPQAASSFRAASPKVEVARKSSREPTPAPPVTAVEAEPESEPELGPVQETTSVVWMEPAMAEAVPKLASATGAWTEPKTQPKLWLEPEPEPEPEPECIAQAAVEDRVEPTAAEELPPAPVPSPIPAQPKAPVATEVPREGQGRKKSRGGRSKGKRRSWGQDGEEAPGDAAASAPVPQEQVVPKELSPPVPQAQLALGPANRGKAPQQSQFEPISVSKEKPQQIKATAPAVEAQTESVQKNRKKIHQISVTPEPTIQIPSSSTEKPLESLAPQPELPKPAIPASVPKEKPSRSERAREPEPKTASPAAIVQESAPMPLAVPKEKPTRQQVAARPTPPRESPQSQPQQQQPQPPPQLAPSPPRKDDDQLDFLLSLKKPFATQQVLNFAAPTSAVKAAIDEDEPAVAPLTSVADKKTEDLEDWLDSMLDD